MLSVCSALWAFNFWCSREGCRQINIFCRLGFIIILYFSRPVLLESYIFPARNNIILFSGWATSNIMNCRSGNSRLGVWLAAPIAHPWSGWRFQTPRQPQVLLQSEGGIDLGSPRVHFGWPWGRFCPVRGPISGRLGNRSWLLQCSILADPACAMTGNS